MISLQHISKTFITADRTIEALKDINLDIKNGDIFGIIGMSGAGKSTLVRCINLLEIPTEGKVIINGKDLGKLNNRELRNVRRKVSMIFQGFNLLMQRNCLDNICLPLEFAGVKRSEAKKRAEELLEIVGLPDKARSYPAQLSGGQQQRIAIARALTTDPEVLLCDEATSALDPNTTHSILQLIRDINAKLGITVVIITHQMSVVEEICTDVAILDKGSVAEVGKVVDVFSNPQSDAAKRLVYPDTVTKVSNANSNEKQIRLVFNGADAAGSPLIAKMAIELGIAANILAASTKQIGDKVYGNMILGIPGGEEAVKKAIEYLTVENVTVGEVSTNE